MNKNKYDGENYEIDNELSQDNSNSLLNEKINCRRGVKSSKKY